MKQYYTYIWKDPKTDIIRYVGKGNGRRANSHKKANSYLGNMIRNRRNKL